METIGKVHSLQSLGTVDGPGVRYIVFLQGCNLRCKCCHNPDTWEINGGKEYTPNQILSKLIRFREYFGKDGGLTFSGGEPLLQCDFVLEVFKLCKDYGIHTCIDTSGSIITDKVKEILKYTDYCLLDIKYSNDNLYREHVGCGIQKPLEFLELLQ
jgi:pyruvate formate lyase activating enzyme